MARGLTNAGLCSELHLSTKTVEGHVRSPRFGVCGRGRTWTVEVKPFEIAATVVTVQQ